MDKSKQQRYRENNPKNVEFSQLKQNVKRQNLKETDPEKADLVREANRKRKAAERARKRLQKKILIQLTLKVLMYLSINLSEIVTSLMLHLQMKMKS